MIGFWISAGAMTLMVALLLVQALWQAGSAQDDTAGSADLAVYRDQLAEIGRDQGRGVLAPADAQRLRLEVQRRMLETDGLRRRAAAPSSGDFRWYAVGAVVLCLGAGIAVYADLGVPGYPDLPLSTRLAMADEAYQGRPTQDQAEAAQPAYSPPPDVDPELAAMLDKLRAAVAKRPDDLLGHTLLAQNEAALGNFVAARKAQDVVVQLMGVEATAGDLSALAQLMVTAAGGAVTPEAEKVLIKCLQIDPRNGWARYYSGLMFAQIGRPDRAFALWEPLLREGPGTAPWIRPVKALIGDVAADAGINFSLPSAAPGPDAAAVAAASDMTDAERKAMIATMVTGLEQRLNDTGGSVEEWAKLITSLGVLDQTKRAKAAYDKAQLAFEGKPGELAALQGAAVQAGVAP